MRMLMMVAGLAFAIGAAAQEVAQQPLAAAQSSASVSPEGYGRLPAVSDVAISPDGRRVALAESNIEGVAWVTVVSLDNPADRKTYALPSRTQLRSVGWIDDAFVSFVIERSYRTEQIRLPAGMQWSGPSRRINIFRSGVINLETGASRMLFTDPENDWADWGADLVGPIVGDAGFVRLIGGNTNLDRGNAAIYRVSMLSGHSNRLTPIGTNLDTIHYALDAEGRAAVRLDADRKSNRWGVFTYDGETPRKLMEGVSVSGAPPEVEGLLPDGRVVLLTPSDEQNGFDTLYAYHRTTGARETLFAREGLDVARALTDPWTRQVVGAAWVADDVEHQYFEPDLQRVYAAAVAAVGGSVRLESWSRNRTKFVVYGERALDGGAYYLFTPAANTIQRLALRYPEIAARTDGQRQAIRYRARDGVRVPAILTLPLNQSNAGEQKGLPLVLLPHGGPHGPRDDLSFDWWATFLASRGYAVLQPNYRGSGGYGAAWQSAGYRQWGGLMQRDIEDGVDALARSGIIDPARVCIVGGSYGGYAALAGVSMTPQRYRCAVSVAGVSDLSQMLLDTERRTGGDDSMSSDWWRQSIGDREEDKAAVRAASPANLADAVTAPVLLIHGTEDTVVPIEQSRRMQRALERAGKKVRFVELRGDDHWLSDAPTRIQMLRETEAFLAEHLPVARPATLPPAK